MGPFFRKIRQSATFETGQIRFSIPISNATEERLFSIMLNLWDRREKSFVHGCGKSRNLRQD
jgi:hypothetical protein